MVPPKGDEIGISVREETKNEWMSTFGDLNSIFDDAPDSERMLMLKRLKEVKNPVTTSLITPSHEVQTRAHGRPKSIKAKQLKSTK